MASTSAWGRMHATSLLLLLLPLQSIAQTSSTLTVSENGDCGSDVSQTCLGSRFGNCCSSRGFCGSTTDYCGADCQIDFGTCSSLNATLISADGNCGASDPEGQVCLGSTFGNCCSPRGFCGSTSDYCGTGCQSGYGNCGSNDGESTTSVADSATSSSAASTAGQGAVEAATEAPADTSPPLQPTQEGISTGAKAGIAVGAVGAAALVAGALFFFLRRRRRQAVPGTKLPADDDATMSPSPPKSIGGESISTTTAFSPTISSTAMTEQHPPMPMTPYTAKDGPSAHVSELAEAGDRRVELNAGDKSPAVAELGFDAAAELPSERYSRDLGR
ncbi:uncharacterized protein HMPREF1541_00214 [Cyphellophora europaea CBS 101466]|uniref:Chitin-binding type-1 domain-containing protein n=1 Tax=Cyphellophora europaea (strain CBS 101466) TaxID=1220924 RepID=W2SBC2_CYPE1|nr:uncharacterized protein HMPREF1541_00214 [Cyphellophora europaea CBS 101466]ETN46031.1 hypothetical protein HMPREF1541_00214 [Cyphellophora europaea CBS 101466]